MQETMSDWTFLLFNPTVHVTNRYLNRKIIELCCHPITSNNEKMFGSYNYINNFAKSKTEKPCSSIDGE